MIEAANRKSRTFGAQNKNALIYCASCVVLLIVINHYLFKYLIDVIYCIFVSVYLHDIILEF